MNEKPFKDAGLDHVSVLTLPTTQDVILTLVIQQTHKLKLFAAAHLAESLAAKSKFAVPSKVKDLEDARTKSVPQRKKWIIATSVIIFLVLLAAIIGIAVGVTAHNRNSRDTAENVGNYGSPFPPPSVMFPDWTLVPIPTPFGPIPPAFPTSLPFVTISIQTATVVISPSTTNNLL